MNCRSRSQAALPGDAQPLTEPAQKTTFAEMRDMGVRGVVACSPLTMGVRPAALQGLRSSIAAASVAVSQGIYQASRILASRVTKHRILMAANSVRHYRRPVCARSGRSPEVPNFSGQTLKDKGGRGHYTAWPSRDCSPRPSRNSVSGHIVAGGGACLGDGITHSSGERTRLNQPVRFKQHL